MSEAPAAPLSATRRGSHRAWLLKGWLKPIIKLYPDPEILILFLILTNLPPKMEYETEDHICQNQNIKFEMGNGRVIAIGNVGSLGAEDNISEGNSTVRRNVISLLARLQNKYGRVDGLFFQEKEKFVAKFSPLKK